MIKSLCAAMLMAAVSFSPAFADAPPPESFAKQHIAAVNAKDISKLKATVHSKSLACLTGANAEFLNQYMQNRFRSTIPDTFRVSTIVPIKENEVLMADGLFKDKFTYNIRPAYRLQIDYPMGTNRAGSIMAEVALDGNEWKEVLPCPKDGTLAWMKQQRAEAQKKEIEQAKKVDSLLKGMDKEYKESLKTKAKGGHWIDAAKKIARDKQVDDTTAFLAMKSILPPEMAK